MKKKMQSRCRTLGELMLKHCSQKGKVSRAGSITPIATKTVKVLDYFTKVKESDKKNQSLKR